MALPHRLGGLLVGAALSMTAMAACLGVIWLGRNHQVGVNGGSALPVLAAAAAVPAVLLAATALLLLRARTPDTRNTHGLTASAVLVSVVPLEVVLLRETWAVLVSSAFLAVLVVLVLSRSRLRGLPIADSRGLALDGHSEEADVTPGQRPSLSQADNDKSGKPGARDHVVAAVRNEQVRSETRSFIRRKAFDADSTGRGEKAQRRTPRLSKGVRCIWDSSRRSRELKRRILRRWPGAGSSVRRIGPGAPSPERGVEPIVDARKNSNALSEHLATLSQALDQSIERLGRICDDIDLNRESERITPAQEEMDPVASAGASDLSAALTGIVSRLDALCARLEPCVDRLERYSAGVDERLEEEPAPSAHEATESIEPQLAVQSRPLSSGPDELSLFREQVNSLVSRLQSGTVGDSGHGAELQVISDLRERLDRFLRKPEAEDLE